MRRICSLTILAVLLPVAAFAHAPASLVVTSRTDTTVSLDWTQSPYDHSYDGYYIRTGGGPRVLYPSSQGTITGLGPGTTYRFCVTVNYTSSSEPDEGPQACIDASTTGTAPPEPGGLWRPYADTSPFNTPVFAPVVSSNSARVVARLTGTYAGPSKLVVDEAREWDYQHPRYHAKTTDPAFRVTLTENWGTSVQGHVIHVPVGALAAGGGDGHMAVVQPDGWEYDFYDYLSRTEGSPGTLKARWGGRLRIDGDGRGGQSTVANFGLLAGPIRSEELIAGEIPHALFATVKCSNGTNVYPALTSGAGAVCSDKIGAPPLGARFWLAYTDAEIDALNIPVWRKTIVRAMARYGAYFGDTGGPGFAFQLESPETYRSFGLKDPAVQWAAQQGVPLSNGKYRLDLRTGVDWAGRLRMIDP